VANKRSLAARTDPAYPGWDLEIPDTRRADRWLAAFAGQGAGDSMPALTILWLPNDHTAGARGGKPAPRAYGADTDPRPGRGARRDRRGADAVAVLAEHRGVRARGRRAGRSGPRGLAPLATARDLRVQPAGGVPPVREHAGRARDDRPHPAPRGDVEVRPARP